MGEGDKYSQFFIATTFKTLTTSEELQECTSKPSEVLGKYLMSQFRVVKVRF